MDPKALVRRARLVGLELSAVAAMAGVHRTTVFRMEEGGGARLSTFRKVERVVVGRERELLAHLIALHPDKAVALLTKDAAE